jgi:hypothetical protein
MAAHSVSIAAAAASLGATQLKQPEKVTPRWPRRLRQKIARKCDPAALGTAVAAR